MTDKRKDCLMRHENGNCTVAGGFCTAVNDPICEALHNAFDCGYRSAIRQQWISVKDYLPEEGKIVMVHQIYSWERQEDGAAITIGRLRPSKEGEAILWQFQHYRPDFRNWNCIDNDIICPGNEYITHWKPLPETPEDGTV